MIRRQSGCNGFLASFGWSGKVGRGGEVFEREMNPTDGGLLLQSSGDCDIVTASFEAWLAACAAATRWVVQSVANHDHIDEAVLDEAGKRTNQMCFTLTNAL